MRLFIFVLIVNVLNLWMILKLHKNDWYYKNEFGFVVLTINVSLGIVGLLGLIFSFQRLIEHHPPYLTYAINWLLEV